MRASDAADVAAGGAVGAECVGRVGEHADIARLLPRVGAIGIQRRKLRRTYHAELGAGFGDPHGGHLHIEVLAGDAAFQPGEHRIIEQVPPVRIDRFGDRHAGCRRDRLRLLGEPGCGGQPVGRLEIRPHGAGAKRQQQGSSGNTSQHHPHPGHARGAACRLVLTRKSSPRPEPARLRTQASQTDKEVTPWPASCSGMPRVGRLGRGVLSCRCAGGRRAHPRRGTRTRPTRGAGAEEIEARRHDADARPGRGPCAHHVHQRRAPDRSRRHAARGTHADRRAQRAAAAGPRLHRRLQRGVRQAAHRRRDPQRDRGGRTARPSPARLRAGDHRDRRVSATTAARTSSATASPSSPTGRWR